MFEFVLNLLRLCFGAQRLVRIEMHPQNGLPVPCGTTPAFRVARARRFIDLDTTFQQSGIDPLVTLSGGHELDGAVTVLKVVPKRKGGDPLPCRREILERTSGITGLILQGFPLCQDSCPLNPI